MKGAFEAKDADGQFWDVVVHSLNGDILTIDVMQDGKIVKKGATMPATALRHKLLMGMTGLYQALDSNGNWFNINFNVRRQPDC